MASIVEKEAVDPASARGSPRCSSTGLTSPSFTPRRLETDPTIRYGCMVPVQKSPACRQWDKDGRLHRAQLDDKANPYNTYEHDGLPPGPIANPGKGRSRPRSRPTAATTSTSSPRTRATTRSRARSRTTSPTSTGT